MSDEPFIDLRWGIKDIPAGQTPLFDQWNGAVIDNHEYLAVIEEAERKAVLVKAGIEEFTLLEKFALQVLRAQHRYLVGEHRGPRDLIRAPAETPSEQD